VLLWLKVTKSKRSTNADKPTAKKVHLEKIICDELEERHSNSKKFSLEQLRAWAHIIQMKKHESYEAPPDKPFFNQVKKLAFQQIQATKLPLRQISL